MKRREFLTTSGATAVAAALGGAVWPAIARAADPQPPPQEFEIGHSRVGRPIKAYLIGDENARSRFLVMGQMHGDEPAGPKVCEMQLLKIAPRTDIAFWVVPTMNPDGRHRGSRVNAHGVDLNRNFPSKTWKRQGKGTRFWSGPKPASEPETRAMVEFFSKVQPHTLISMHQPLRVVDFSGGDPDVTRWLARNLRLPFSHVAISGGGHAVGGGTMTSWYNRKYRKQTAVTVEMPPKVVPEYRQHVAKVFTEYAAVRRRQQLKH